MHIVNIKNKKALEEAVANGVEITIEDEDDGEIAIAKYGYFPGPVTWRAVVTLENGRVVKVK